MKYIKFQRIALTAALISATIAGFNSTVMAQEALESTKTISGRIDDSSPPVFISGKFRPGREYTFQAVAGDDIKITAARDQGSAIDIALMVYPPNQQPIEAKATNLNEGTKVVFLQNSIETGGTWKVRVFYKNDKPGNYSITLLIKRNGAVVQPADPYIATINSWGATRVDCNTGTAVVRIAFEANKAYCIQPTSAVPAGDYTYDRTTGAILPLNADPQTPSYTPGPVNPPPDDELPF
jgi:hypothetical protein